MTHFFLYGPPGSGKSTLGRFLGEALELPFIDLDEKIAAQAGRSIPEIFAEEGEEGFRRRETAALEQAAAGPWAVIALGGGALLDGRARELAEARGRVLLLTAEQETLAGRMAGEDGARPLIDGGGERLARLLEARSAHYASFPLQIMTDGRDPAELAWQAQARLGAFRARGMGAGTDVRVEHGGLEQLAEHLAARNLVGPLALVSDSNVGPLHGERLLERLRAAGFEASLHCIPAGEAHKTIATVQDVWGFFLRAGVERGSCVLALGGGVVGDLTGFAASSYLRGVPWVNLPTTLLAMVDSSLGGKTGVDLPQAKNLVGAFYPPALVLADTEALATLPVREMAGGMAEVVKHGIIGDPALFELCARGWDAVHAGLEDTIKQAMAVKLKVIEVDPYEKGARQALNLGHTIGHGVELASGFRLSHGEAVSVGTVLETRLAEDLGLAEQGLTQKIRAAFTGLGLPVAAPAGLDQKRVLDAMQHDKKKAAGALRFALPVRVGAVRTGVVVENWQARVTRLLQEGEEA